MMKYKLLIILFFFGVSLLSLEFYSPLSKEETIYDIKKSEIYKLKIHNLIINSEFISADTVLIKNVDYKINYLTGEIHFSRNHKKVQVSYQKIPTKFLEKYYLFEVQKYSDSCDVKLPHFIKKEL